MILSCNSLTTLSKLAMSSTRRPMVMLVCIAWIAINIVLHLLAFSFSCSLTYDRCRQHKLQ